MTTAELVRKLLDAGGNAEVVEIALKLAVELIEKIPGQSSPGCK